MASRTSVYSILRDAVERERDAASRLAIELERTRDAARGLDVHRMGALLTQARVAADDLARAGGQRSTRPRISRERWPWLRKRRWSD